MTRLRDIQNVIQQFSRQLPDVKKVYSHDFDLVTIEYADGNVYRVVINHIVEVADTPR